MAAEEAKAVEQPEEEILGDDDSLMGQVRTWIRLYAAWWGISFTFHMLLLSTLLLIPTAVADKSGDEVALDSAPPPPAEKEAAVDDHYEMGEPQLDPGQLTTESLMQMEPAAQTEKNYDDGNPVFVEAGKWKGFQLHRTGHRRRWAI